MKSIDEIEVPGPPAHGAMSPKPLLEGVRFVKSPHAYTTEKAEAAGCPVFHAHPGVRSVMVSDHASMTEVFQSPPEALDRDGSVGFGCVRLFNETILHGVVPALVSDRHCHGPARALVIRCMDKRGRGAFEDACADLLDGQWSSLSGPDPVRLDSAVVGAAGELAFRWWFGLPGPPGDAHLQWLSAMFGLTSDSALSEWLARVAISPPGRATVAYSDQLLSAIRGSAPFGDYVGVGDELGMSEEEVAAHLLFAAGFNATGGSYTTVFPTLGVLVNRPDILAALREELDGFAGGSSQLDALPYLDALMYESQRFFGRPKQYYRAAQRDVVLPTSDGRRVRVPEGTRLGVVAVTARQDPAVFSQPDAFDPGRFIERNDLKDKVFAFGPSTGSASSYGCAGASNGTAPRMWKVLVASMARRTDWELSPQPRVDLDASTGLDPQSVMWCRT